MRQQPPLRWGIVGLGTVVEKQIMPAMQRTADARVVACCGSTAEKSRAFAARFGVERPCKNYEELVRESAVDAVYIATPNGLHHPVALAAARAGKHVLCEKPLALSVEHAREMVDAFAQARLLLRVAFQIRFEEILRHVREAIAGGAIGDLRLITCARTAPVSEKAGWRQDPAQGGILFDVAIHLVDLVQWMTGRAFCEISAYSHPDRRDGVPDTTVVVLGRLGADCHVTIRASNELPFAPNEMVVEGTRGFLAIPALRWVDEYVLRITNETGTTEQRFAAGRMYQRELEAYRREWLGERTALPDGEEALRMVELAAAVHKSICTRQSVAV